MALYSRALCQELLHHKIQRKLAIVHLRTSNGAKLGLRPTEKGSRWRSSPAKPPKLDLLAASSSRQSGQMAWREGALIRMLYDGDCPLCMREVNMLRRRDHSHTKIDFVDISSPSYTPEANAGISYEQAMGEIHGILPDGRIVTNIEVFRRLYEAVGLGWVYAATKFGPVGKAADWLYAIWARFRLPLTGRSDLETILAKKKSCKIR